MRRSARLLVALAILACSVSPATAQQKAQWLPGQSGLNAGVMADPGFSYVNLTMSYTADSMRDSNGDSVPVDGTYDILAVENVFTFTTKAKVLGARYGVMVVVPIVNGSVTIPQFGLDAGGYGLSDVWVQPLTLGWQSARADFTLAYAFMAPAGRFTLGADDNLGSGYWGNHFTTATTAYLTKNKAISANLYTDWEAHGKTKGTDVTPGQAFTTEWGVGLVLPLDRQLKKLLQVGLIGYDQWQVTDNSGTYAPLPVPAPSLADRYAVDAVGLQVNFIVPAAAVSVFFKYEHEYRARAHPRGDTTLIGGAWTLRFPKATP